MKSEKLKINRIKIKKGDRVKVLLGKDRGKEGKVIGIDTKNNKVLVERVNTYKRHVRKYQDVEGGILDITKPVDLSNVALVCPHCKKITRVGFGSKSNDRLRICKKCGKRVNEEGVKHEPTQR